MAEFITKCPHCNAELQAQDEWNGMEVECPLCHKMFAINKSSAIVETEKTEAVTNWCDPKNLDGLNYVEWVRYFTGLIPFNVKDTLSLLK